MSIIIAFAGPRKSGKTTAAFYLQENLNKLGLKPIKLAFADPAKERFCKANNIGIETLYLNDLKEVYREQLIKFAEEERRKDPFIYINLLFEKIFDYDWVIIDDLRRLDELKACLSRKALIIKIQTDLFKRKQRGLVYDQKIDEHYTETELDLSSDFYRSIGGDVIFNNKTTESLDQELGKLSKNLVSKYLYKTLT